MHVTTFASCSRYRNVLLEILKHPEAELAECLKAFVEASMFSKTN